MKIPDIIMLPPNRVWRTYLGGKVLDTIQNNPKPSDSHFPEDWIASTTTADNKGKEQFKDEGLSEVEVDKRKTALKYLMQKFPSEILGEDHYRKYGANSQYLLKLLDSSIRLHIQAHPTIPFAKKYLNSNSGKTEAYVILGIREEVKAPYIYLGFQKHAAPAAFKKIILNQDIHQLFSCFEKIPVKPGDVFIVPGGLPHAIGEGVFMIEIMEPTDFVVRVEFERGGYVLPEEARFMGRDVDFAIDMIDFTERPVNQIKHDYFCQPRLLSKQSGSEENILIDNDQTPCFSVHQLKIKERFAKKVDTFYVGIVTNGSGTLSAGALQKKIKQWDKFFIPFNTDEVQFISDDEMEVVLTFPPK
jgi:mannose-6-phosphate isomerase